MAEDRSRKRDVDSPSNYTRTESSKHARVEDDLETASSRQSAQQNSPCNLSNVPTEPEEVQFFVKSLSGETLVVREPVTRSLEDLKQSILQRWTHGRSSQMCEAAVFFTCEGKHLSKEWQTLGGVPVRAGSTLVMRVRLRSTSCRTVAEHSAKLQELAKKMVQGQRTDAMVGTFLMTLNLHLLTPGQKDHDAEHRVATFVGTGGLEAITSLLGSNSSFVALYTVQLLCKHLADASLIAVLTGWHLLDALLDRCSDAARSDSVLSNYLRDLFNRLCGPSAIQKTFLQLTSDQNCGGVRFAAVFAKLAARLGVLIQRDAACLGQGSPLPAPEFPSLKEVSGVLDRLQRSGYLDEQYEKCREELCVQLSPAVEALLGDAIEATGHREYARQIVAAALDPTKQRAIPLSRSLTLRGLPPTFFEHLVGCLRALTKAASGRPDLEAKVRDLLSENSNPLEDLLTLQVPGTFTASEHLRCVFELPYRDLWPLHLKESCLRDYLPFPLPVSGHRVDVRRGSQTLADAFSGIEEGFDARTLSMGIVASFQNEAGLGPGVIREFFTVVSRELFNPEFALFRTAPADRNRLFPNLNSDVNPGHLSYFRFCGRFIALAIAHEMPLGITLCSALAHGLLRRPGESPGGQSVGHFAARDIDPELFESCERLLQLPESEVAQLGLTFVYTTERLGGHTEQELCRGGHDREVTAKNRAEFVNLKVRKQLLEPVRPQIAALREGLQSLLCHGGKEWREAFGILTEEEFNSLLHGSTADISIEYWMEHTTYHGYTDEHPVIQNFWLAVQSLNPDQQRNLLFFATAVRYLPSIGFAGLSERFHIHHTDAAPESLPRAHTCYFQLVLPAYGSYELMKQRLMTIVQQHVVEGFGEV